MKIQETFMEMHYCMCKQFMAGNLANASSVLNFKA